MKERLEWVDIAKGIGIICVVAGHSGCKAVADFVYLFHLSLFVYLSGYFWRDEFVKEPRLLLAKRIKKLYSMYWRYEVLFLLLRGFLFKIGWYQEGALYSGNIVTILTKEGTLKELLKISLGMGREPIIGATWFVIMLIITQLLYGLIRNTLFKLNAEKYSTYAVIATFIFACITTKLGIYIPRLSPALFSIIFFHCGANNKKQIEKIKRVNKKYMLSIVSLGILAICSTTWQIGYSPKIAVYPLYFILMSLLGIFVVIVLSKGLSQCEQKYGRTLAVCLRTLGGCSFEIMVLHFCAFKIVSQMIILIYNLDYQKIIEFPVISNYPAWSIVYTIVGILVPTSFCWCRKILLQKLEEGVS